MRSLAHCLTPFGSRDAALMYGGTALSVIAGEMRSYCHHINGERAFPVSLRRSKASRQQVSPSPLHHNEVLLASMRGYATSPTTAAPVNLYRRLRISHEATRDEIKAAYRARALECHPDVVDVSQCAVAEVTFRGVSEAYETLSDPIRRRAHDERLGITGRLTRDQDGSKDRAGASGTASAESRTRESSRASTLTRRSKGYTGFTEDAESAAAAATSFAAANATSWRKPYVRGDADRAFSDAFAGKSLDQILFEARRRKRAEAVAAAAAHTRRPGSATNATGATLSAHKTPEDDSVPSSPAAEDAAEATHVERAAGHVHSVQRAMSHAAERYAARMQTQFGTGVLTRVYAKAAGGPFAFVAGAAPSGVAGGRTAAPPSTRLRFRPFLNTTLPPGVEAPPDPKGGPVGSIFDADVIVIAPGEIHSEPREGTAAAAALVTEGVGGAAGSNRQGPTRFHEHRLRDGTRVSRMESLRRARRHINGAPHNQGQLYSYQRPY